MSVKDRAEKQDMRQVLLAIEKKKEFMRQKRQENIKEINELQEKTSKKDRFIENLRITKKANSNEESDTVSFEESVVESDWELDVDDDFSNDGATLNLDDT